MSVDRAVGPGSRLQLIRPDRPDPASAEAAAPPPAGHPGEPSTGHVPEPDHRRPVAAWPVMAPAARPGQVLRPTDRGSDRDPHGDPGRDPGGAGDATPTSVIGMPLGNVLRILLHVGGTAATGALVGMGIHSVAPDKNAPWILGRASGIACLLLLTILSASGLMLSHPWRARRLRPNQVTRIRMHVSLAVFTLALFVVHIVVLATDPWAKVGWWGALLPMASSFHPVPVTLGVVAGYSGLISGLTAVFAARWTARLWAPLHKVAALALVLAWLHGLFAGSDTAELLPLYLGSGALIMIVGMSRYVARTSNDRVRELIETSRADEEDLA